MKKVSNLLLAALCAGFVLSCTKESDAPSGPKEITSFESDLRYEYLEGNFCNPERGTYSGEYFTFKDSLPEPYSVERLAKRRETGCTLIHMSVYLWDYAGKEIPAEALSRIEQMFDNLRQSGCKCILRFAYRYSDSVEDGLTNATSDFILTHIRQLQPILEKNTDIIYVVQMGFVGVFGEWHTDRPSISTEERAEIVKAMLEALPANRQIALRTPVQKMLSLGITDLRDTITAATAFDGSDYSRIGGFNDCLFASFALCHSVLELRQRQYHVRRILQTKRCGVPPRE